MHGHDFPHADRQAGDRRAQVHRDVVEPGIRSDLTDVLLFDSLPGVGFCWVAIVLFNLQPGAGLRWVVCIHDEASNSIAGSLAYQAKYTVDTTNCQH